MTRAADRMSDRLIVALSATPWLLLLSAYGEAALAAVLLARWPRPWHDDPMSLATAPLHLVTILLMVMTVAALLTLAVLVVMSGGERLRSVARAKPLLMFAAGVGLVALLVYTDPGAVWYWLGD